MNTLKPLKCFIALGFTLIFFSSTLQSEDHWIDLTGGIKIEISQQKVKLPITVVNLSGGLEFIVSIGTDKDYESVFSIKCSGKELHLALETVGFEPLGFLDLNSVDFSMPQTQLQLKVEFEKTLKPITAYLMWQDEKQVDEFFFYFCGSYFREHAKRKEYAADLDLNVIAAYGSKGMILGPLVSVANPYQEKEGAYLTPNAKTLPPVGTTGWLLIQKRSP